MGMQQAMLELQARISILEQKDSTTPGAIDLADAIKLTQNSHVLPDSLVTAEATTSTVTKHIFEINLKERERNNRQYVIRRRKRRRRRLRQRRHQRQRRCLRRRQRWQRRRRQRWRRIHRRWSLTHRRITTRLASPTPILVTPLKRTRRFRSPSLWQHQTACTKRTRNTTKRKRIMILTTISSVLTLIQVGFVEHSLWILQQYLDYHIGMLYTSIFGEISPFFSHFKDSF